MKYLAFLSALVLLLLPTLSESVLITTADEWESVDVEEDEDDKPITDEELMEMPRARLMRYTFGPKIPDFTKEQQMEVLKTWDDLLGVQRGPDGKVIEPKRQKF